jgi:hypothetical protein
MILNNNAREEWDRAHASYSKVAMSLEEYTSLLHFVADGLVGAAAYEKPDPVNGFDQLLGNEKVEDLIPVEELIIFDEVLDTEIENLIYQQPFEGFPS